MVLPVIEDCPPKRKSYSEKIINYTIIVAEITFQIVTLVSIFL